MRHYNWILGTKILIHCSLVITPMSGAKQNGRYNEGGVITKMTIRSHWRHWSKSRRRRSWSKRRSVAKTRCALRAIMKMTMPLWYQWRYRPRRAVAALPIVHNYRRRVDDHCRYRLSMPNLKTFSFILIHTKWPKVHPRKYGIQHLDGVITELALYRGAL